jgi:hypothetical protein
MSNKKIVVFISVIALLVFILLLINNPVGGMYELF